ncbi:Zn(2+) transporter [Saccharomycopsis crataegensis]|uniref:Zn(2+) transporter n=1 Tax=Saccharomycopsis crataegensis TaxID=43959 RepID=A0AAV5QJH8_9ASCO|nr:Zn(2+) transporter [Saccharomycopsis crataegensis]
MSFLQDNQGWVLTLASSAMCLLGCSIIYVDVLYAAIFPKIAATHKFEISTNGRFLIACLSLSSGSLLLTALAKLLPHASDYLNQHSYLSNHHKELNFILMSCFFSGIVVFMVLDTVIHKYTSESIIHCAHGDDDGHSHDGHHHHDHDHDLDLEQGIDNQYADSHLDDSDSENEGSLKVSSIIEDSYHHHHHGEEIQEDDVQSHQSSPCQLQAPTPSESTPLLMSTNKSMGDLTKGDTIKYNQLQSLKALKFLKHPFSKKKSNLSLVAYSPTDKKCFPIPVPADNDSLSRSPSIGNLMLVDRSIAQEHIKHSSDHRHINVQTSVSKLFSIGVQTTLAMTLHKFPEGFIYYTTSKIDESLSLNIFLSLAIHNIAEGLCMAIPLYLSLNSRMKAIAIAGILGGFSQPFGALLGQLVLPTDPNEIDANDINLAFGCLMSLTSGFLVIIGLKMLLSSVGFGGNGSHTFITFWFIMGMFAISCTNILTGSLL